MLETTQRRLESFPPHLIWLSLGMLHLARFQWQFNGMAWAFKPVLMLTILGALHVGLRWMTPQRKAGIILTALLTCTIGSEILLRYLGCGEPLELVVMELFGMLGITGLFCHQALARKLTSIISVFLATFLFFIDFSLPTSCAGLVFLAVLLGWLIHSYWVGIEGTSIDRVSISRRRWVFTLPILIFSLCLATFASLLQIPAVAHLNSKYSPFSGGEAWADAYAMSGIGDGEALVAATESAQSEGPVDSDLFMESKKRSLYDIVSDEYGEAKKPQQNQEMNFAVSLSAEKMQKNHKRLAQAQKNSATFSISREASGKREQPSDLTSDALLLVDQRGPLVLKLNTFDTFDGQEWSLRQRQWESIYGFTRSEENDWYCLKRNPQQATLRSLQTSVVSIIHLESEAVPTPPILEAWSIRQVNRREMYRVADDQLMMNIGNALPEFTQISLVRHGFVKPATVSDHCLQTEPGVGDDDPGWQQFNRQAFALVHNLPRGSWQRVERIQDYLRNQFSLQRVASAGTASESAKQLLEPSPRHPIESPLLSFWKRKVGDDYHFATAGIAMLRAAGFRCRLAQGFYVSPDRFDPRTGKSTVGTSDLHTWVELEAESGVWLPVEVSPGFLETPESRSIWDLAFDSILRISWWCLNHPVMAAALLFSIGLVAWFRDHLRRHFWWVWWRLQIQLYPEQAVRWTLNWCRRSLPVTFQRAPSEPVGRWIERVARHWGIGREMASWMAMMFNRDLYATKDGSTANRMVDKRLPLICREWVSVLSRPPKIYNGLEPSTVLQDPCDLQRT